MEVLEPRSDGLDSEMPNQSDPGGALGPETGPLEVFTEKRRPSIVVAEALRCQVKITTRRSLHLRIANHTARDVYVKLVGQGGCIAGTNVALERHSLERSAVAVKEPASLSPLKVSSDPEPGTTEEPALSNNQPPHVSMETSTLRPQTTPDEEEEEESSGALTISELVYSPCASLLPTPVEDSLGGVDLFFSSPVQSPARLLRELHADPDIQAQLEAERERDRDYERTRLAARRNVGGVLSLLSSNERVTSFLLSVARLVAVVMGVLLVSVPTLLLLLESDIDVSFLHEIRQTPEFEQFHYEYYCPLRRWIICRFSNIMDNLWSD